MLIQEDLHLPITDANDKEKKVNFVVNYFATHRNRHTFYALKFFACEILNLINVFSQIYFMDFFLGGKNLSFFPKRSSMIAARQLHLDGSSSATYLDLANPWATKSFLIAGEFSRYGSDLLSMSELPPEEREDPMSRVFPKMTKCTFHKFGPSGTVEKFDGLCVLPLNIINEKIYLFLWFWFIFLTVLSALQIG